MPRVERYTPTPGAFLARQGGAKGVRYQAVSPERREIAAACEALGLTRKSLRKRAKIARRVRRMGGEEVAG